MRIVVTGDSRASSFGAPAGTVPFPELLGGSDEDWQVLNLAESALLLDRFQPRVAEVVAWRPDVVVSAFGGREALYRLPKNLRRLRCDPFVPLRQSGPRWLAPVLWLRRAFWRFLVLTLQDAPARGERQMQRLGATTYRTTEQYRSALGRYAADVLATGAHLVILEYNNSKFARFPWSPSAKLANNVVERELAAAHPGRVFLFDPKRWPVHDGTFVEDGVHYTALGHRQMAERLSAMIAALPAVPASGVATRRVPVRPGPAA